MRKLWFCAGHLETHPDGDLCPSCRAERRAWRRNYRKARQWRTVARSARQVGAALIHHPGHVAGWLVAASWIGWCLHHLTH